MLRQSGGSVQLNLITSLIYGCVVLVAVVTNFVVEKYRPRLALIATFVLLEKPIRKQCYLDKYSGYTNFDHHPGTF